MLAWKNCPICKSKFTVYLQEIYLQRQETTTPQYYCMTCRSFFHRSNCEMAHKNDDDATWLAEHAGGENADLAQLIVNDLGARRVFEAGCGVGELLLAVQALGASAEGIDPNARAVAVAVQKGAQATTGYFWALPDVVDAVVAIDVIEHVTDPRLFFWHLRESVVDDGIIIVRVPEVNEDAWHYLEGADRKRDNVHPDPFIDNSVHINHFSEYGLIMLGEAVGATYVGRIVANCHLFRRAKY